MFRYSLLIIIVFSSALGFAQDSTKLLPEVSITPIEDLKLRTESINNQLITADQIDDLQPEDLGTLLQKTSGTSIKSYGGLGGLKTISVRGLNSQHTIFVLDGFVLQNAQTGQVNFGQVMVDNVADVSINEGGKQSFLLPVSAFMNGSLVSLFTKNNQFENKKLSSSNVKMNVGSFGQIDSYLSSKHEREKYFISSYIKYRKAKGNYNYSFLNGFQNYSGERLNNDLNEKYGGVTVGYQFKNQAELRSITNFQTVDQGLPGAVVLYNDLANQRLLTNQFTTNLDYTHSRNKFFYRIFSNYSKQSLNYKDPSFLNNFGGINITYTNEQVDGGVSFQRNWKHFDSYGGVEYKYNQLVFSTVNSTKPQRNQYLMMLGGNYKLKKWSIETQVSGQAILESKLQGEKANDVFKLNPFLAVERKSFNKWKLVWRFWYRNSFRMPSFNELYYNNIGNILLKPEEANQFSTGISLVPFGNKIGLKFVLNTFYNEVKNQILALPTKNLFVWSMQNIGNVQIYGFETRLNFMKQLNDDWKINGSSNYTLQFALDVSNNDSPTYRNQVAYMPKHTGNFDVGISFKEVGFTSSLNGVSKRYSLNENIPSNEVKGFMTLDLGIYLNHKMMEENKIRVQFMVKNVTNASYNYVRYFVMPGRNYLITFSYAIH